MNLRKLPIFPIFLISYICYCLILISRSSFVINGVRYFSLFDDMMISMRYANHLAQGKGLVWNMGGERIEGFSNPLWTIYMSLVHLLPHSPNTISLYIQLSGLVLMALNLYVVFKILNFFTKRKIFLSLGLFLVAFYFPLNNWGVVLGTEVCLLTLITTFAAYLILNAIKENKINPFIYVLLGASTLVRMDSTVLSLTVIILLTVFVKKNRYLNLFIGIGVLGIFIGMQEALRLIYYNQLLPNTYFLKLTGYPFLLRILRGIFVLPGLMNWLLVVPFIIYLYFTKNKYLFALFAIFLAQLLYSVYVGGDAWESMGGSNRYITSAMPVFFCLFIISGYSIFTYLMKSAKGVSDNKGALLFVMFVLISFLSFSTMSENMLTQTILITPPATKFENENQVKMAISLAQITLPDAAVGIVWAGIVPYFTERNYVDLLGKNDKVIAHGKVNFPYNPSRFIEKINLVWPGHNKWNYDYVLKKKIDVFAQAYPADALEKITKNGYTPYDNSGFEFFVKKGSKKVLLKN